jgi:hypothetical protein
MAEMVSGLRQFIVDEQKRILRENETPGATERKPVPESFLDLMITDYITLESQRVGDFLAIERDEYGDSSERIIFIVLRRGKYSIEGTTVKTMMRSPNTSIYYNCTGYESVVGGGHYDPKSKALKIDLGQTIYVFFKQINQLISAVKRKSQRIFFAVPAGVEYERTVSEGVRNGSLDFVSGYHCQTGSSIQLYNIELCSDDVCSITRRIPPMFPQPVMAPPVRAQKRRRTAENIMQDRDSKIEIIRMLQAERNGLLEAMDGSRNQRADEIRNRFEENDQQLELLEKEVEDDERRVKRKVAKEQTMLEKVRRFTNHTNFINEFRAKMVEDATNLAAFLADGPHDVDVSELKKLHDSMMKFLYS